MNKTNSKTFLVIGGDLRQTYLARKLAENYPVYTYATDLPAQLSDAVKISSPMQIQQTGGVDFLVLPMVSTSDGVCVEAPFCPEKILFSELLSLVKKGGTILGGKLPTEIIEFFESNGVCAIDYFENEELVVKNSTPTAEGALQIAMEELPITIFGSKVLVTGFGRVAKTTARLFNAVGAQVTVTARKYEDLAWAEILGCKSVHLSGVNELLPELDIVINTVPAVVLDKNRLSKLGSGCLVIDLASKPGGVDFETARELGIKAVWALSLPGKVAPVSAGEIIAGTIQNILTERGELT